MFVDKAAIWGIPTPQILALFFRNQCTSSCVLGHFAYCGIAIVRFGLWISNTTLYFIHFSWTPYSLNSSVLFLYSFKKSYPNSLVIYLCCIGVSTFWSSKYLRLCWSIFNHKGLPQKVWPLLKDCWNKIKKLLLMSLWKEILASSH